MLLEAEIDIISFDAYQYAASFALFPELIQSFLERSGVVAWGLIPTSGDALAVENLASLQERMQRLLLELQRKKVDLKLVRSQSLVTPACGTGMLTGQEAVRVYELTSSLAEGWDSLFPE
jgi:hypothetical protein